MENATATDRLRLLAEPIVVAEGLELVHIELQGSGHGRVLRLYIDKPEGITHADCERVSRQLNQALDAEEAPGAGYTLEVSSPGLDRPLVKPEDFQRFAGLKVQVQTNQPLDGRRRFTGKLEGWRDGAAVVRLSDGSEAAIAASYIERARLAPEWPSPSSRPGKKPGAKRT